MIGFIQVSDFKLGELKISIGQNIINAHCGQFPVKGVAISFASFNKCVVKIMCKLVVCITSGGIVKISA